MTPIDRAEALGHAHTIAARLEATGMGSSNLSQLIDDLRAPGLIDASRITRLQTHAANFEVALLKYDLLHIGGRDLAALRYLLSEALPEDPKAHDDDPHRAMRLHAESFRLQSEAAAALTPTDARAYSPGRI